MTTAIGMLIHDQFLCTDRRDHARDRGLPRCALVSENTQLEADAMADAEVVPPMRHHACDHEPASARQRLADLSVALDAAVLAIDEYYNGDRAWAEEWLLKAAEANGERK
jgi:hypothetical protein